MACTARRGWRQRRRAARATGRRARRRRQRGRQAAHRHIDGAHILKRDRLVERSMLFEHDLHTRRALGVAMRRRAATPPAQGAASQRSALAPPGGASRRHDACGRCRGAMTHMHGRDRADVPLSDRLVEGRSEEHSLCAVRTPQHQWGARAAARGGARRRAAAHGDASSAGRGIEAIGAVAAGRHI